MAVGRCEQCGVEEYMPFVCKFCRGRYCASHRLPENHGCRGLGEYRERVRAEGRLVAPEADVVEPSMSMSARMGARFGGLFERMSGKATYVFLGLMAASFLVQVLLQAAGLLGLMNFLFVLDPFFYLKPWTIVTSIFAHGSFGHLLINGLILFFFGPTLERLLGTRRFSYLFLGGGALAGLAQVLLVGYALPQFGGAAVIGASGGIQAILGTLTVLAPTLSVLVFFVIPAPLWLITTFYALADLAGLFNPGSPVAHLAHLAGLAVGLLYGKRLRDQGMRVQVNRPQQPMSRRF